MASSKIRKALGAMKDQTSIGLAKVSLSSAMLSDLDVAIVKATRHDELPADERHIREILSLTSYSRAYVGACVSYLSRRLSKTRSWAVALKTLILIHRLLAEGEPTYEQEIFFATRRGTRMLNMSDFRDSSGSDAWDFSTFVRTYALYLDERLDYRMQGRRKRLPSRSNLNEDDPEAAATAAAKATPVREMKTDLLFTKTQHLQQLMERFLACRPTGAATNNRIVAVALYPLVKESFQIYYDLSDIMNIFVDRFMELDVPDCVRVHDIFTRLAKQFEELSIFYGWSKSAGVCRSSEYPEIEHITAKKLEVMDDFIREKSALAQSNRLRRQLDAAEEAEQLTEDPADDMNAFKALPPPEEDAFVAEEPEQAIVEVNDEPVDKKKEIEEEVDFLNLKADTLTTQEHGDRLALAFFDGNTADAGAAPKWEAFSSGGSSDWETTLVQTASKLSGQKASLGGGFDMLLLDGMYSHANAAAAVQTNASSNGSASSIVLHAPRLQPMMALPAPPASGTSSVSTDPFAASTMVPPPSYVQMSDMERKHHLLTEEQMLWQQYERDGMHGQYALYKLQQEMQYRSHGVYPAGGRMS